MKLTEFEKWILDQALDMYVHTAVDQIQEDERNGKHPIVTSDYIFRTVQDIYEKLKLGKANGND